MTNKPKIFYRIIETDPSDLQISVRFYSEALPESELVASVKPDGKTPDKYRTDYAITLPVPVPTGDALHELIMTYCPVKWFDIMHAARDPSIDTGIPHIAVGTVREVAPIEREPTEAEQLAAYEAEVQFHMERAAQARGYDSLMSAISYADEPAAPQFQLEGLAFRAWRSACWLKCHEVLNAYQAGSRAAPTVAELIAELPLLDVETSAPPVGA